MATNVTIPMARLVQLETAEHDRDLLGEQLECVRQALPMEWRRSVPSVAVATLAAELDTLRQRFYTTRCPAAHLCDCQEAGQDCARGYKKA